MYIFIRFLLHHHVSFVHTVAFLICHGFLWCSTYKWPQEDRVCISSVKAHSCHDHVYFDCCFNRHCISEWLWLDSQHVLNLHTACVIQDVPWAPLPFLCLKYIWYCCTLFLLCCVLPVESCMNNRKIDWNIQIIACVCICTFIVGVSQAKTQFLLVLHVPQLCQDFDSTSLCAWESCENWVELQPC